MSGSLRIPIHRTGGHGHQATTFRDTPSTASVPAARALHAARALAVAHKLDAMLARGDLPSRGDLARAMGITAARLSQLFDLTLLAPDIQEELLWMEVPAGRDPIPERALRYVVRPLEWSEQRRRWAALRAQGGRGSRSAPWAGARPSRNTARRTRATQGDQDAGSE